MVSTVIPALSAQTRARAALRMLGTATTLPAATPSQQLVISSQFRIESFDTTPWPIVVLRKTSGEPVWAVTLQDKSTAVSGAKKIRFSGHVNIWFLRETRVKGIIEYEDVGFGKVDAPTVWIINQNGKLENFTIGT